MGRRSKNPNSLDYWVQYLIHYDNLGIIISIGFMTAIIGLISVSFIYYNNNLWVGFFSIILVICFLTYGTIWIHISEKSKLNIARNLLDKILKGEITDYKEIVDIWYKTKKPSLILLSLSLGVIAGGIIHIVKNESLDYGLIVIMIGVIIIIINGGLPSFNQFKEMLNR